MATERRKTMAPKKASKKLRKAKPLQHTKPLKYLDKSSPN
jgi:hypothetical protein